MPDDRRRESADLGDYKVLDGTDTLNGAPGDDPLDRGVVTPEHWSAAIRYGPDEAWICSLPRRSRTSVATTGGPMTPAGTRTRRKRTSPGCRSNKVLSHERDAWQPRTRWSMTQTRPT